MVASPHIVVLGAGSVGCYVGGAWLAAGLDVTFIGREAIAADVAGHGLSLSDESGWKTRLPPEAVKFFTKPVALGRADIVLLTVKSPATAEAAQQIARHAKREPVVISFQNGVSNVETLETLLPKLKIVQGLVPFNVAYLGEGRWHKGVSGDLFVEDAAVTKALADRIGDRAGRLQLRSDMASAAWGKLLLNLNNAVNALSGKTLLEELSQRDYRRILAASMVEALEIMKLAGIRPAQLGPIPPNLLPHAIGAPDIVFRNLLLKVMKIDATARTSMFDDLAAGRQTEIDYLNGEVVKLARSLRRRAPVNERLVELVKQREAGIERLWSAAELREYVLERHPGAAGFGY
jgi:2-dehydropantoate 2-reductase